MAVACTWYDRDLGPVLYREQGTGDGFESAALLEGYLRQTDPDDHSLVVVEDAVRDETSAIFEVMHALDDDPSVTFLLDARTHEWDKPERATFDARLDSYRRSALNRITVPAMDERECERFVDHFAALVDVDPALSGVDLFELVGNGSASRADDTVAGDALIAQHYLTRRYDPSVNANGETPTALEEAARYAYEELTEAGPDDVRDLAVLVALLTAAGVPVADDYLYALATDDEYAGLEAALEVIKGRLLFERTRPRTSGPLTYRTRHETWAQCFLEQVQEVETIRRARQRVGRCVTRLLALADDPDRREKIERHLGGRTPYLHQVEADPGGWADELAERIFGVGRTDANLAPLFGETTDDAVELPDACSGWTRIRQAYWRGKMNENHGALARAEREFRTLEELVDTVSIEGDGPAEPPTPEFTDGKAVDDEDETTHRTRWRATARTLLGRIAETRGEYETAEEYHREALSLFRYIGDRGGEATCLDALGVAASCRSDYDQARDYHDESLAIFRDLDDRRGEASSLHKLGNVAWRQSEYDWAREYYEESLAIRRDLDDRRGAARSLGNLGLVAQRQSDHDRAREYQEQALAISRDLGDRRGVAKCLGNLGDIAQGRGDHDRAREYHEQALATFRDLGDRRGEADSLLHVGTVAREQGEYDLAREYHEESLATFRALDNRRGEAFNLDSLGIVAREQGEYDLAREYHEQALATFRDIGDRRGKAVSLLHLGVVARLTGEYDRASARLDRALPAFECIGDKEGIARVRREYGHLALARDDVNRARERTRQAHETFEELGATHQAGKSHLLLGRIAAVTGHPDEASEHWRAALETFEDLGTYPDALDTLEELVDLGREQDDETTRQWRRRARELVAEAPDPTADQHRDWTETAEEDGDTVVETPE